MPRSSAKKAQPINQQIWELHKDRIVQLWTTSDKNLSKVIGIIKEETGFQASMRQYYRQLHEVWKIKKNFTATDLKYIDKVVRERETLGKETVISRAGRQISKETLKKRHSRLRISTRDMKRKELVANLNKESASISSDQDIIVGSPTIVADDSPRQPFDSKCSCRGKGLVSRESAQVQNVYPVAATLDTIYRCGFWRKAAISPVEDASKRKSKPANISTELVSRQNDEVPSVSRIEGSFQRLQSLPVVPVVVQDSERLPTEEGSSHLGIGDRHLEETDEEIAATLARGLGSLSLDGDTKALQPPTLMLTNLEPFWYMEGKSDITQAIRDTEETPLDIYSNRHRKDYVEYIEWRKQEAISFLNQRYSQTRVTGELLEADPELQLDSELLPLNVHEQILNGCDPIPEVKRCARIFFDNPKYIPSGLLDRNFQILEYRINKLREGHPFRGLFHKIVIHLPRFISKYGYSHFLTAHALHQTAYLISVFNPSEMEQTVLIFYLVNLVYTKLGISHSGLGMACWYRLLNGLKATGVLWHEATKFKSFISKITSMLSDTREKVFQVYGKNHPRMALVSSLLASVLLTSPSFSRKAEILIQYVYYEVERFNALKQASQTIAMISRSLYTIGDSLLRAGRYFSAIKFLESSEEWYHKSGKIAASRGEVSSRNSLGLTSNSLGLAYSNIGKYKRSLEMLFTAAQKLQSWGFKEWASEVFLVITEVTDKRGPVFYNALQPSLLRVLNEWKRIRMAQYCSCYELLEACAGGEEDEYTDIIATRSLVQRARTPDLQEYIFFQNLEGWVYFHNANKVDEQKIWELCDTEFL